MKKKFVSLILAALTFVVLGCKKSNVVIPSDWDLSGKIVFNVGYSNIYVLDVNSPSLSLTTLTSGGEPRVNQQGTTVVYDANSTKGYLDIYSVSVTGGTATDLSNNTVPNSDSWPDWSSDGNSIVFNRVFYPGSKEALCVMNNDGSNLRVLTDTASLAIAVMPRWSPDGNAIAFLGQASFSSPSPYSLYIIAPDGSNQIVLDEVGSDFVDVLPRWSSDSRKIAYGKSHQYSITDTMGGIFVIDIVNKTARRISIGGIGIVPNGFSWLTNNELVCIAMNSIDTTYGVYLVSVSSSGNGQLLARGFNAVPTTSPSPDGKFISIFGQRSGDATLALYVVQSDGTNFHKLKDIGISGHITDYYYSQWIK